MMPNINNSNTQQSFQFQIRKVETTSRRLSLVAGLVAFCGIVFLNNNNNVVGVHGFSLNNNNNVRSCGGGVRVVRMITSSSPFIAKTKSTIITKTTSKRTTISSLLNMNADDESNSDVADEEEEETTKNDNDEDTTTTTATSSDEKENEGQQQEETSSSEEETEEEIDTIVTKLKRDILALAASYDRGYGATDNVRDEMNELTDKLSLYNKIDDVATGFEESGEYYVDPSDQEPLKGVWQMIWTTAYDVLSLATPICTVSAIYQDINPRTNSALNIIDLIPRTQSFLPPNIPTPVTRLVVQTKASRRGPKRIGLLFESVQIEPLKNIINDLPIPIKFDLPTKYVEDLIESNTNFDTPGYFDVTYVDNDMLIIKQNAPGGYFISVKVPSSDL